MSTVADSAQAVGADGAGQGEASAAMASFYSRGAAGFARIICRQWGRAQLGDSYGPHPSAYDVNGGRRLVGGCGASMAPPARVRPQGPTMDKKQKKEKGREEEESGRGKNDFSPPFSLLKSPKLLFY